MTNEDLKSKLALVTDISFEKSVIGAILLDFNSTIGTANELIKDSNFFDKFCANAYKTMTRMYESGEFFEVDTNVVISEYVKDHGSGRVTIEGVFYENPSIAFRYIKSFVSSTIFLKQHCLKVFENYLKRESLKLSDSIALAVENDLNIIEVLNKSENIIETLKNDIPNVSIETGNKIIGEYFNEQMEIFQGKRVSNDIYLGFHEMDQRRIRILPTDFAVIMGSPGTGKTALSITLAMQMRHYDHKGAEIPLKKVGIVSLEMSNKDLIARAACQIAGIDHSKIRTEDDFNALRRRVIQSGFDFNKLVFAKMEDENGNSSNLFSIAIRQMRELAKQGCEIIFLDYLSMLEADAKAIGKFNLNDNSKMKFIVNKFKQFSKKTSVPVVALVQMSRKYDDRKDCDKRPRLTDMRESGDIEQLASLAIGLFSPSYVKLDEYVDPYGKSHPELNLHEILEANILKNRNGSLMCMQLKYQKDIQRISEFDGISYNPSNDFYTQKVENKVEIEIDYNKFK